MDEIKSSLVLRKLVFDKILFEREGFKNDEELKLEMQVQVGIGGENDYKVSILLRGNKAHEYHLEIAVSGFFMFENYKELSMLTREELINKNAVAILMPYLRSEVTLLTSQPETDSVVLPVFNIHKMMN